MPSRTVHHTDGVAWLANAELDARHAIVTSLPDHGELPRVRGESTDAHVARWRTWFIDTVALACRAIANDAVAVFYQTDVKHDGRWIDKGHLVHTGIDAAGSALLWHKIVCRVPAGTVTRGRPSYAHILAASRSRTLSPGAATADVLPTLGAMTWSRAMGADACAMIAAFVVSIGATCIVDPFCGVGTMLAAANAHGLDAIGVELSRRRADRARTLEPSWRPPRPSRDA